MKHQRLLLASALGLGLTLAVVMLLNGPLPARAGPAAVIRYVTTTGDDFDGYLPNDCTSLKDPCRTVQHAVSQADPGDEIYVATGLYTDIHARSGVTQVVYIDRSVLVRGGYTSDFTGWNPKLYPTTLNAKGGGRVVYVSGDVTAVLEGLRITEGDSAGLGGAPAGDAGGGIYVGGGTISAEVATVENNVVYSNTAKTGGGVLVLNVLSATVASNVIHHNVAEDGGGIALHSSHRAHLTGNEVHDNATSSGGGTVLTGESGDPPTGDETLAVFYHYGGGIHVFASDDVALTENNVTHNHTVHGYGGGVYLGYSDGAALTGNLVSSNTVSENGGGVHLRDDGLTTFTNNVIVENQLNGCGCGAGVAVEDSEARMLHTTIARNRGGVGGVCALGGGSVALTNTILVSHATGIQVYGSNTGTLEGTLWGDGAWANDENWGGTGAISTGTVNVWGDPAFVDPDGWDYHVGAGSAAINAGVETEFETDMDGDPRPPGRPPDIGADECMLRAYLPVVLRD